MSLNDTQLSSNDLKRTNTARLRVALGVLAIIFYLIHGGCHVAVGAPKNLLWACLIANVMVAAGLLMANSGWSASGTLILCVGTPSWLVDVVATGEFMPTSPLVHFGTLACGLGGVALMGIPRFSWFRGVLVIAFLLLISFFVSTAAENINVVHHSWFSIVGSENSLEHLPYLVLGWGVGMWGVQWLLSAIREGCTKKRSLPMEANVELA